jgi:outer membrane protein TolC
MLRTKRAFWFWLVVLFLCLLYVSLAGLSHSEPNKRVMTLEQLISMALKTNPEIKERQQDVEMALSDLRQAKAAYWPQLDALAIGGVVEDAEKPMVKITPRMRTNPGTWVATIEKGEDDDGIGPFGRLKFTILQPIYTFGKISNRKKAAEYGVEAERLSIEQKRGELIRRVKELYYALILARQGKGAAQEAGSFVEDARRRIKRLLEIGSPTVDQSDLYRLEAYAAEIERFKGKADTGEKLAYIALKQIVGFPPEEDFELDLKELPKDFKPLEPLEVYVKKALKLRPELEQIRHGLEARRFMARAAKADMFPSIFAAISGSFAGAPGREHLDEPYIGDKFNHANVGAILGARWHLDLGISKAKVDKARAQYQRLLYTKRYAELTIPLEVAKYYQKAREFLMAARAYEKAAKAARKWIVVAFANFDMGIGPARDIFLAVERYGRNQGEYLNALFRYHLALCGLEYATGAYRDRSAGP